MAKKKKTTKKTTAKKTTAKRRTAAKKFSFLDQLHENVLSVATVTRTGDVRIKRTDLKGALEDAFNAGAKAAASGERVRFPIIGTLVRKEVKARKAGTGTNPFTGEAMKIKARPATKKPRWSFPKAVKETFSNKRYW